MMRALLLIAALALPLSGCSTVKGWFSDSKKSKIEGERIDLIADDPGPAPSPTLEGEEVAVPDAVAPEDWPQSGGVAGHYLPNIASTLAGERQSARAGEGETWVGAVIASPVVGKEAVYAMDGRGYVSAHARGSLDTLWTNEDTHGKKPMLGGGLAVGAGRVFVTTGNGRVLSIDAKTGKTLWHRDLLSPVRAAPLLLESAVVVITVDSETYALDRASGAVMWQHRGIAESASLLGSSVPAAAGPLIVSAYNSGEIYALSRRDGTPVWNDSLLTSVRNRAADSFTGVSGDPVVAGSLAYTVSTNGVLSANDLRTGIPAWEQHIASHNTPWIAGDYLYLLDGNDRLYCIKRQDGRVKWMQPLVSPKKDKEDEPLPLLTGPWMVNGQLLVIDPAGRRLLASPKDGRIVATQDFPEGVLGAPAFADGGMYVVDRGARLRFFK